MEEIIIANLCFTAFATPEASWFRKSIILSLVQFHVLLLVLGFSRSNQILKLRSQWMFCSIEGMHWEV